MRVLVTGGAGAIGSHLVRALVDRSHDVVVLDDLSSADPHNLPPGVPLIVGSVDDAVAVAHAFELEPDGVIHLAALFANANSVDHPVDDLLVNGLGTLRVLEAARRHSVGKVVYCSSSCVYAEVPALEESETRRSRSTPYAVTKALGEDYATLYARLYGLDIVSVRPFNAYGPFDYPGPYRSVIPNFIRAALDAEPLKITGTGEETRDFTYAADVAEGLVLALLTETEPGDVFNLASGTPTSIADLAVAINRLTGNVAGVRHLPRREWDQTLHRVAITSRAEEALGFRATTPIEEGLRRTIEWFRTVRPTTRRGAAGEPPTTR